MENQAESKYYLVHFIESHESNSNFNLNISGKDTDFKTEIVYQNILDKKNIKYISFVYCIKIPNPLPIFEAILQLKEENDDKSIYEKKLSSKEIKVGNKSQYIFLFDVIFKNPSSTKPSKIINLESYEEFDIYLNLIRKKYKILRESKENEDFICNLYELVAGKDKKYEFFLYISMISESIYSSKFLNLFLKAFNYEKLLNNSNSNKERIKKSKEIINNFYDDIESYLKKINNEKDEESFYMIILYFNQLFQRERFEELLESNKKEKYLQIISKNRSYFPNFKRIIKETINLDEIKGSLSYIKNCFEFLNIIYNNKDHILNKYLVKIEELKKKENIDNDQIPDIRIQADNYIGPNIEDDLKKILQLIEEILKYEIQKKVKFINFSPKYFENFVKLSYEINLDNLIFLKSIVDNFIKKMDKSFKIKDLDDKIHETGIKLINDNIMNNFQILDFIQNDIYYSNTIYESSNERDLNIFKKLNVEEMKEDFIEKWKKINFGGICKKQEQKFYNIICSLITKFSQINLLIQILYENKKFDQKKAIKAICDTFENKFINCPKNELVRNYLIIVDLIYYLDNKGFQLNEFLNKLENNLDKTFLLNIIINLLKTKTIRKNSINLIYDFIGATAKNGDLEIIKKIILLFNDNNKILSKFIRFAVEEKDFLEVNETFKLKLFKELLYQDYFSQNGEDNIFVKTTNKNIKSIKKKFDIGNFTYNEVSILLEIENDNIYFERLCLLYLVKSSDIKKEEKLLYLSINQMVNMKFKERKEKINSLELILNDFICFFPNSCKNEIEELSNYINKLKNENLNKRDDILDDDNVKNFIYYQKHYLQKAKERNLLIDSLLFNKIYEIEKLNLKNNETKILDETIKQFIELEEIFNEKIKDSNPIFLKCIKLLNNRTNDEIKLEIKKLVKIFKIKIEELKVEKIIENLILMSDKDKIISTAKALITFINETNVKQEEYTATINVIIESSNENLEIEFINMCLDVLKALGIDLNDKRKENCFPNILLKLTQKPEIIQFLLNKNYEDCRLLQEIANNNDNSFLTTADIIDFEKCVEFMNKIGSLEEIKNMTDCDLVQKTISLTENYIELEIYLNNFIEHFEQIKKLIKKEFDKSESSNKIIENFCHYSCFKLSNKEKNYFEGKIDNEEINLNSLLELRDRVLISKSLKETINKIEIENMTKKYKFLIKLVCEMVKLYDLLNDIYRIGYTEEICIEIKVNNCSYNFKLISNSKYLNIQNEYDEKGLEQLLLNLKYLIKNIKSKQTEGYNSKIYLRYIYGRQFNYIYNHLKKNENEMNNNIIPFLKYITNNELKSAETDFQWEEKDDEFESIIDNCNNYIEKILIINNIRLENIYMNSLILDKFKEIYGLYIYSCSVLEKEIFQLYKYLTNNIPIAQNILICNKDSSKEEIIAFLYRAILCQFHSCFIIGGIESLEFEQKNIFLSVLNKLLFENNGIFKSCLIILSINKSTEIYKSLCSMKYKKTFYSQIEKELQKQTLDNINNIKIISSDKSGIGKSTKIKNEIIKNEKLYIYFPLGGVFTRKEIIQRLKKFENQKNAAIHLDLFDTDNIDLMLDFLFWILITRLYKVNEDIVYLLEDTQIYIEIPNGFINFFAKFQILDLIPKNLQYKLLIKQKEPLIVDNKLDSNIQIVSNYLKLMEEGKIDTKDLYIPNVTQDDIKLISEQEKTLYNAKIISQDECQRLILEAFNKENENLFPSYYQLTTFIDVLAEQFKKFNQSYVINAAQLKYGVKNLSKVRTSIIDNFIKLSSYFTEGAFTHLINTQNLTHNILFGKYNEKEDIKKAINSLANDNHFIISFDKIKHSLFFFHEGNKESFTIITNKTPEDLEYQTFIQLLNSQKTGKEKITLPDFKDEKNNTIYFLKELKEILNINNPITDEEKKEDDKYLSLKEITKNYAITPDNFIKMILILLRIRSNIPVIMMGETGCGKTALIKKLAELKNNGKSDSMKILNIHAGTTDKDIIDFIEKIIPLAKNLEDSEKITKELYTEKGFLYNEKKLWVFLDEINTCKSMGIISELMCKHSYQGNKIPKNIIFIGACNPYREAKLNKDKIGLDVKEAHSQKNKLNEKERKDIEYLSLQNNNKLVYTVNPLPHSLLNFVFDFGNLKKEDEEKYIEKMIDPEIENINQQNEKEKKLNEEQLFKIKQLARDMIVESQNFIREHNDVSSVSLRDIRRFIALLNFFYKYLKNKKENLMELVKKQFEDKVYTFKYEELTEFEYFIYSINLSIFICYYLRVSKKKLRKDLLDKLNKIFIYGNFLELPEIEERFIANNIQLKKGIAKNKALLDNLFSLFCAINTKIPLFIVGKPGFSKSLSVQLIYNSMKGSSSKNELFKIFPKIILHCFQGSLCSTSEEVVEIFEKASKSLEKLKKEGKSENISMIFFDEMGLAEHSPNNPLKVIHSRLEYDDKIEDDSKIAFVGISNWSLDASKMNRGIHISISEPDEKDDQFTALSIAESYDEEMKNKYSLFFTELGITYNNYKEYLKNYHSLDGKENFHGSRDFYHFIKYASSKLLLYIKLNNKNIEKELPKIGIDSIERNFGGIQFNEGNKISSIEKVKSIYKEFYPNCNIKKKTNLISLLRENRKDSRYLMLISKSSESCYLLSSILKEKKDKEYIFFIGSQFKEDMISEEYQLKILNKFKIYMEKECTIILKGLESIYPALYDLFNQNFTVMSNRNFARISIGSKLNIYSYVNDNFKCIVNIDVDAIDNQEAPFLNRFEKHLVSYENLLNEDLINESHNIEKILYNLISFSKGNKFFNYNITKLLINCNLEEIQGIIYNADKKGIKKENMKDIVISKIAPILPQDIIIPLFFNDDFEYKDLLIKSYAKYEHSNFSNFLETIHNNKNIIYTFSKIFDTININNNIKNAKVKFEINKENIKIIQISGIKSEIELEKNLDEFFSDENLEVCLIQFKTEECKMINYIKFFIENKEKEVNNNKSKMFIFIVHIERVFNYELKDIQNKSTEEQGKINDKILKETIPLLSDYFQVFIDDLNGDEEYSINKIILNKNDIFDLFLEDQFNQLQKISYLSIDSIINNNISKLENNIVKDLYKLLEENDDIKKELYEYIKKQLYCPFKDLFRKQQIVNDEEPNEENEFISDYDIDMINVIKKYVSNLFSKKFNEFLINIHNDKLLSFILSIDENNFMNDKLNTEQKKDNIKKIKIIYFKMFINNEGKTNIIEKISKFVKNNVIFKFRNNEFNLRFKSDEELDIYLENLKEYCNETTLELKKENFIAKINENINKEEISIEIYDLLLDNYYTSFILNNLKIYINSNQKNELKEQINIKSVKKMLLFMIDLNNKKLKELKESKIKTVANTINWLECYVNEISSLLKIYFILESKMKIENLFDNFENMYKDKDENVDKDADKDIDKDVNKDSKHIVNDIFFYSIEYLLRRLITNIIALYSKENKAEIINYCKEIIHESLKINESLNLHSFELFSFQEIIEIINSFEVNKIDNQDKIKFIVDLIIKEDKQEQEKIPSCLEELYNLLSETFGQTNNFPILINLVLESEFNKFADEKNEIINNYILKTILSKNEFIVYSSNLIRLVLDNLIVIDFNEMDDLDIFNDINIFEISNEQNKPFLDEILLNYFESKINLYFKTIIINNNNKKSENKGNNDLSNIIRDVRSILEQEKPLKIFNLSVTYLNGFSNANEKCNLYQLFSISYIKIYLRYFYYHQLFNFQDSINADNINKALNVKNNLAKVLHLYIFKLLFSLANNKKILLEKIPQIISNFYNEYSDYEKREEKFYNYFLPLQLEKKYKMYLEDSQNIKDLINLNLKKDNFHISFSANITEYGLDYFISIIINQFISNLKYNKYFENKDQIYNLCNFIKDIFQKIDLKNDSLMKLLLLYLNEKNYEKLCDQIKNYNNEERLYYILLYGFFYCVISLQKNNEFLYASLISNDCSAKIKKNYILGNDNDPKESHINSHGKNEIHFNENITDEAINIKDFPNDDNIKMKTCSCNGKIGFEKKDEFLKERKTRKLSKIGYRLLNFIFYSHLFFAKCLEFISDLELKEFQIEEMTINKMIEENWNKLNEALKEEYISPIEIFMNLISPKLAEFLANIKSIETPDERNKLEDKIELIIKDSLNNYNNYKRRYIKENDEQLNLDKNNPEIIVNELVHPEKYPEEEYPMFKHFMLTEYPNKHNFWRQLQNIENYEKKYPLINQLLLNNSHIENLKYIPIINRFSNNMIKNYSFKISREEAKKMTLIKEIDIMNGDENKKEFNDFCKAFNTLKENAIFYKNLKKMKVKEISEKDKLINFLIDETEFNYGIYIAALYQSFISWQNEFIYPIIDSNLNGGILQFYVNNLKHKIPIQKAEERNILSLKDINLENIIMKFSRRNIFIDKEKIDYINYNSFIYDFDSIEKELGSLILSGKCLFDENDLTFVSFLNENNSEIFTTFNQIYSSSELSEEDQKSIKDYFNKGEENHNLKSIFDSLLSLIFYLINNKKNATEKIAEIINNSKGLELSEQCKKLLVEDKKLKELQLNQLLSIFLYLEDLYYKQLIDQLDKKFKIKIEKEKREKIKKIIKGLEIQDNLSLALRRYQIRYLIGYNNNIKINFDLISELYKSDLWELKDKLDLNRIKEILNENFSEFNLKMENINDLYNLVNEIK